MPEKVSLRILEDMMYSSIAEIVEDESAEPHVLGELYREMFEAVRAECKASALEDYRSAAPEMLRETRQQSEEFALRNLQRWRPAFDQLEILWRIAQELGEAHGHEMGGDSGNADNTTIAALSYLFPKALLVTQEIICLLKGGFPDGALARWRSLHELSITAMYIAQVGEQAAVSYLQSFHFAARRAARQMNEHSDRLGLKRFSSVELAEFDNRCDQAERALGRKIEKDKDGEWPAITITHRTIVDIERFVGMEHWRPYYKWASAHTHAAHRPFDKLLGLAESSAAVHLVGQSNSGFVDPFQMTAITLAQITTTYLLASPNADRIVHCDIVNELAEQIGAIAKEAETSSRDAFESQKAAD